MKRFFVICLSVLLICSLLLPVSAGNVVILNYEPWLFFYDLVDCDENYNIWLGMYSYGGSEELYPIHVDEDDYNAKLLASETPAESVSEITDVVKPESVEPDLSDGNSVSSDLHSESDSGYLQASSLTSGTESSGSQSPMLAAASVPSSGLSYVQPELVKIDYAPDATSGTLLAVLYGLLGKPVTAYTYKVRTSYQSDYTGYVTEQLDYDANWLASLALLIVVLFCIFKAGGALLCKA